MDRTLEQPMDKRAVVYLNIPFGASPEHRPPEGPLHASRDVKHRYMEALGREVASALPLLAEYSVPAIYVGGGSPSVMLPDDVSSLLRRLREGVNLERGFELSMEAVPQTVGTPCMDGMKTGGVNRVCLRVPSGSDVELERLGCGFTRQRVEEAMMFLARFNFRNLGFDTMYGLPGQNEKSLCQSLKFLTFFEPEHITLTRWASGEQGEEAERAGGGEGTAQRATEGGTEGAGDEGRTEGERATERAVDDELFGFACEMLAGAGYRRYAAGPVRAGIADVLGAPGTPDASACFTREDRRRECRLLTSALDGCDVFGFGLGATSLMGGVLCTNTDNLALYLENSASYDKIVAKVERVGLEA